MNQDGPQTSPTCEECGSAMDPALPSGPEPDGAATRLICPRCGHEADAGDSGATSDGD